MKSLQGTVVSMKQPKTAIVEVARQWKHPLYKKFVKRSKRYACHVEGIKVEVSDNVSIVPSRPISKTKRFRILEKIESKA